MPWSRTMGHLRGALMCASLGGGHIAGDCITNGREGAPDQVQPLGRRSSRWRGTARQACVAEDGVNKAAARGVRNILPELWASESWTWTAGQNICEAAILHSLGHILSQQAGVLECRADYAHLQAWAV